MARKGRHDTRRHGGERDHDPHHERDDHRQQHRHEDGDNGDNSDDDGDDEDGDSPARQAAIIALRWLGSVKPTAELYARARQQWLALPGATMRQAAELQLPSAASDHDDGEVAP